MSEKKGARNKRLLAVYLSYKGFCLKEVGQMKQSLEIEISSFRQFGTSVTFKMIDRLYPSKF